HHDDHHHDAHQKPHEAPWVITVPLILLAIPSVVIGYMTIGPMLFGPLFKDSIFVDLARHPAMQELAHDFHGPLQMGLHAFVSAPFWLALAGFVTAYYMYMVNLALPDAIRRKFQPLYTLLDNKYYLDWFNENVLTRGVRAIGTGLWKGGDRDLIDGLVVNGSWKLVGRVSGVVRWAQSGYLYHYALAMIVGVFVLMTYFVWLK
ncbi:MAG: NADH-quinone oxidoreductase subunit L, partial [Rhodoferax sp.]